MFLPYTGEKCRKATALSFFISSNACRQLSHQTLERFLVMNVRCLQGMANCLTHKGVHGSKSTRHWNNLILWIASVVPWPFWYLKRYSWCFDWSGTIGWVCFRPEESLVFILYTLVEIYTCGNIKTGFVYFQTEPASVSTSCKWLPVHFLSLVSNMPKKNIHENNKNHISCFFCLRGVLIPPSLLPS